MRFARLELWFACIAVFLAPINVLRVPAFYLTASDCFLAVALAISLATRPIPRQLFGWATPGYYFGFLIAMFALLASSLLNGDTIRGLVIVGQYTVAFIAVPLLLLDRTPRQLVLFIKVFIASIAVMVLHGIYVVNIVGETNTQFVSGAGRLLGFVERANEAASVMAVTLPLVLWLMRSRQMSLLLGVPVTLLILYGVVLTGSNSGLFAAAVGSFIFVLTTSTVTQFLSISGATVAGIAAILTYGRQYIPAAFERRVLTALESGSVEEAGTFEGRMALSAEAFRATEGTWLIGFGADQYRVWSPHGAPVHNAYLLLWTEGGFLCLIGWTVMMVALLIVPMVALRVTTDRAAAMCALSVVATFVLLINGTPHVYGRFWVFPVFLAFGVGLLAYLQPRRRLRAAWANPAHAALYFDVGQSR